MEGELLEMPGDEINLAEQEVSPVAVSASSAEDSPQSLLSGRSGAEEVQLGVLTLLNRLIRVIPTAPDLMTEAELIEYLRIPEISSSGDHHNVIENLKRMHKLPSVHMCNKCLYPLEAVKDWLRERTINHG